MKIAIVTATYARPDGRTPFYLKRMLDSVMKQRHRDFHIYLIGDNYQPEKELVKIVSRFRKITFTNLPFAKEREKYPFGYDLFCAGGVNADNYGINLALADGYDYIAHLDHDDYWRSDHLYCLNLIIENLSPIFCATKSTYYGVTLPELPEENKVVEIELKPGCAILSAVCINYRQMPLRLRDRKAEGLEAYPADADLWLRMGEAGYRGYIYCQTTCHHDEEAFTLKRNSKL